MALVQVLVDVLEVRIESVGIEAEFGLGIGGVLPCVRDREHIGVEYLWRLGMPTESPFFGDGERPVVAVVAQGADDFFFGNNFDYALQVGHEPILAGDGSGIARDLVLVVVHEHNAVGVGGNALQGVVIGGDQSADVKPQIAGMQVGIEFLDEVQINRSGAFRQVFQVQR